MNDLSSLKRALQSLEKALAQELDEFTRDASIQRFEYTFELSWKAMKRALKDEGLELGSPKQVFRSAHQVGLIKDIELWFALLKERNLTVHTYNEKTAHEVYEIAKKFPPEVAKLISALERK